MTGPECGHLLPDNFAIDNAAEWEARVMAPLLNQVAANLGSKQWARSSDITVLCRFR